VGPSFLPGRIRVEWGGAAIQPPGALIIAIIAVIAAQSPARERSTFLRDFSRFHADSHAGSHAAMFVVVLC
jgi:hypothetical protein